MTAADFYKRTFDTAGKCADTGYNLTEEQKQPTGNPCIVINEEGKLIKAPRQTPTSIIKVFAAQSLI